MEIAYSIDINATPRTVFHYLETPEMAKQWQKGVCETEILDDTPGRIGTTFRERMESEEGGLEMLGSITEFVPERVIAFRLESKIHKVAVRYSVEPIIRGVRLEIISTIEFKFPLSILSWFLGKKFKADTLSELMGECAALKRLCETGFE
ncbi:MAG: SRPBCC family protein [Anaerolineales bacterium]|nr:SRPBCC family protein [Anaerolineales bacterium]